MGNFSTGQKYSAAPLTQQNAPASGTAYTNASSGAQDIYVTLAGVTFTGATLTRSGLSETIAPASIVGAFDLCLNPGDSLTLSYSAGTPLLTIQQLT